MVALFPPPWPKTTREASDGGHTYGASPVLIFISTGIGTKINDGKRGRRCLREGLEVAELLEDSLLGDPVLVDEAADGDHGKAGVLDLSKAVLLEGRLVLGKAEGVEREVSRLTLALLQFQTQLMLRHVTSTAPAKYLHFGELDGREIDRGRESGRVRDSTGNCVSCASPHKLEKNFFTFSQFLR